MELIRNENGTYTFNRGNGAIDLTASEVSLLVNQFLKMGLRNSIEYKLNEMNGDTIDLSRYPDTFEELVDEIFVDLEDEIDYGNGVSDEYIEEKIIDIAVYYDMRIE